MKLFKNILVFAFTIVLFSACKNVQKINASFKDRYIYGTYAHPPRLENGRVDNAMLLKQLKDLNANTYNWLIWTSDKDWDDLQLFLPIAKKNKITIWVTVVPPTESKPRAKWDSEPFKQDYIKWASEIALLSKKYSNITAFSIDDFAHNLNVYTPSFMEDMYKTIKHINPRLDFVPCLYYRQITKSFSEKYTTYLDGVLFPYRAETKGANLQNAFEVKNEIDNIRKLFPKDFPVYLDVYSTAHSRLGASTPQYVKDVIKEGKKYADGVFIYTHPSPIKDAEKYNVVKEEFKK